MDVPRVTCSVCRLKDHYSILKRIVKQAARAAPIRAFGFRSVWRTDCGWLVHGWTASSVDPCLLVTF